VPDPVYALPIVVCGCGYATVRRRHPLLAQYRRARAVAGAVIYLILHLVVLLALSLANGGFIATLEQDVRDLHLTPCSFLMALLGGAAGRTRAFREWYDDGGTVFLIGYALAAVGAGIWLRAALAHWRWPRPLLAWTLLVAMWVWIETVVWPLTWLDGRFSGTPARFSGLSAVRSIHAAEILAVSLLISFASTPIGRGVSRALAWSRRGRFIRRLNKRRKARRGE
jgi:hypothetical protein